MGKGRLTSRTKLGRHHKDLKLLEASVVVLQLALRDQEHPGELGLKLGGSLIPEGPQGVLASSSRAGFLRLGYEEVFSRDQEFSEKF